LLPGRRHARQPLKGQLLACFVPHRLVAMTGEPPSKEHLAALRELIESGKVAPVIDRTYPLRKAPEAIRYLEVEHARAKVVITM
jgi:NADPH:quinone reductase-like Zn-dependent oxidoreductase